MNRRQFIYRSGAAVAAAAVTTGVGAARPADAQALTEDSGQPELDVLIGGQRITSQSRWARLIDAQPS